MRRLIASLLIAVSFGQAAEDKLRLVCADGPLLEELARQPKVRQYLGERFDPNRHQAMAMVPSGQPAQTVVQVFQKGYLLHDRVLRPALVAVSSGPADAPPTA